MATHDNDHDARGPQAPQDGPEAGGGEAGEAGERRADGGEADGGEAGARDAGGRPEPCVFCDIIAGTRPAHLVLDTVGAMAFLDTRPLFKGHTLLVPRTHIPTLAELPAEQAGPLLLHAQRLARAMESALEAAGSFVAMNNRISQSVPHLHVHVVPRNRKDGLRGFFWPRTKYESESEAAGIAARLRAELDRAGS